MYSIANAQEKPFSQKATGKYLDATSSNNVIVYPFHGDTNQQWRVKYQGNGFYKPYSMQNCTPKKLLHVDGDNVDVYTSGDFLLFRIIKNADGTFRIMNTARGNGTKALDVNGNPNSPDYNKNVIQYNYGGSDNQKWYLEKAHTTGLSPTSNGGLIKYSGEWYFDYTNEINRVLSKNTATCFSKKLLTSSEFADSVLMLGFFTGPFGMVWRSAEYVSYQAETTLWFFNKVDHFADWDIKYKDSWDAEFNVTFIYGDSFYYNGEIMTASDLGNYTYGYWGRALRFGPNMLLWGGGVAHVKNTDYSNYSKWEAYLKAMKDPKTRTYPYGDFPEDTVMIQKGITAFNKTYPNHAQVYNSVPAVTSVFFMAMENMILNNSF